MLKDNSTADKIAQVFDDYCKRKNYQVKRTEKPDDDLRLDISNLKDRANVIIYHTSSIVVGGSPNSLRAEMEALKTDFEKDPSLFMAVEVPEAKACATRYDIMLPELRELVKTNLGTVSDVNTSVSNNPRVNIEYTARVQRQSYSVSITL